MARAFSGSSESGTMLGVSNTGGTAYASAISASNTGNYGDGIYVTAGYEAWGTESLGTQSLGSVGVLGSLSNSSGFSNVFYDLESDDGYSAGVWADGPDGQTAGLVATADDTYAGIFENSSSTNTTLYVYNGSSGGLGTAVRNVTSVLRAEGPEGVCGINQSGSLSCTGQVKAVVATQNGTHQVETYSVQSAENWLEDYGSGQLVNGGVTVTLDPLFAETVNTGVEFHVFLTPGGDCKGLYVANKTSTSFEVHELGGGATSIPFDFKIVAKRRGHENERLVDVTERMNFEANAAHPKPLAKPLPRKTMRANIRPASPAAKTAKAPARP